MHGRAVGGAGRIEGAREERVQLGVGDVEVGCLDRAAESGAQDVDGFARLAELEVESPQLEVDARVAEVRGVDRRAELHGGLLAIAARGE